VFAYAQAEGVELRLDATEIQVRRPPASRGGPQAAKLMLSGFFDQLLAP
jgi:hypothetical protein